MPIYTGFQDRKNLNYFFSELSSEKYSICEKKFGSAFNYYSENIGRSNAFSGKSLTRLNCAPCS